MSFPSDAQVVKKLFADNNGLFHLIHQFNVHPAAYAHPTWFETLVPCHLFQKLQKSQRGISRLSKIFLAQQRLAGSTCYDFEYPWWRFALLPSNALSKLTLYCGLAALHRQISAVVDKTQLRNIKKSLGEPDYVFAVKRAPLMVGQQQGIDLFWNGHFDIGLLARQFGTAYFLSHFRKAPFAIRRRLVFKFPRSRQRAIVDNHSAAGGWQLFKRILIHEIERRWQPLFS